MWQFGDKLEFIWQCDNLAIIPTNSLPPPQKPHRRPRAGETPNPIPAPIPDFSRTLHRRIFLRRDICGSGRCGPSPCTGFLSVDGRCEPQFRVFKPVLKWEGCWLDPVWENSDAFWISKISARRPKSWKTLRQSQTQTNVSSVMLPRWLFQPKERGTNAGGPGPPVAVGEFTGRPARHPRGLGATRCARMVSTVIRRNTAVTISRPPLQRIRHWRGLSSFAFWLHSGSEDRRALFCPIFSLEIITHLKILIWRKIALSETHNPLYPYSYLTTSIHKPTR